MLDKSATTWADIAAATGFYKSTILASRPFAGAAGLLRREDAVLIFGLAWGGWDRSTWPDLGHAARPQRRAVADAQPTLSTCAEGSDPRVPVPHSSPPRAAPPLRGLAASGRQRAKWAAGLSQVKAPARSRGTGDPEVVGRCRCLVLNCVAAFAGRLLISCTIERLTRRRAGPRYACWFGRSTADAAASKAS